MRTLPPDPAKDRVCRCVAEHTPKPLMMHEHHIWPLGMGGSDIKANRVWLCPTAHTSVHELIRLLVLKRELTSLGGIVVRPNKYHLEIALRGFGMWIDAGRPGRNEVERAAREPLSHV